jgi:hypothetical protein
MKIRFKFIVTWMQFYKRIFIKRESISIFFFNFNFNFNTFTMANNNNNIPQPPVVNYNHRVTYWTEEQCLYLLDQRMSRNLEFWALPPYNR